MAGCPKCTVDLVRANPHKESVIYPNGFTTFKELRVGERLNVPDKWFSKEFDELPPAYFKALPHPDGVTPSTLGVGAAGVLGDFAYLDAATTRVSVLDTIDDNWAFIKAADEAADAIDAATAEAVGTSSAASASFARDVRAATDIARQRIGDLSAALDAGDTAAATEARRDVRSALTTALGSARLALQSFYGGTPPPPVPEVKTPVKPPPKTPVATPPKTPVAKLDEIEVPLYYRSDKKTGISAAGLFGLGLLGVGIVGGAIYLATEGKIPLRSSRKRPHYATCSDCDEP